MKSNLYKVSVALVIVGLIVTFLLVQNEQGERLFKNITVNNLEYIAIHAWGEEKRLSIDEMEEFVKYLNELVLYGPPNEELEQSTGPYYADFQVYFSNKGKSDISIGDTIVIIDDRRYMGNPSTCEDLKKFYNILYVRYFGYL